MGPSMQQFFSPSGVIATTCFGHTIIIRRQTVTTVTTIRDYIDRCKNLKAKKKITSVHKVPRLI
jgi:hypothetical protein